MKHSGLTDSIPASEWLLSGGSRAESRGTEVLCSMIIEHAMEIDDRSVEINVIQKMFSPITPSMHDVIVITSFHVSGELFFGATCCGQIRDNDPDSGYRAYENAHALRQNIQNTCAGLCLKIINKRIS